MPNEQAPLKGTFLFPVTAALGICHTSSSDSPRPPAKANASHHKRASTSLLDDVNKNTNKDKDKKKKKKKQKKKK